MYVIGRYEKAVSDMDGLDLLAQLYKHEVNKMFKYKA